MRFFTILFLLVFCVAKIQAQKPQPAVIDSPLANSLLWEIKGDGIKKSYLFGTIHRVSSRDFFLADALLKRFEKSKQFVMELDMSNPIALTIQQMALSPMKDNKTLKDLLSQEDYDVVKKYFDNRPSSNKALPFETLETWNPMLLLGMLYQKSNKIAHVGETIKSYELELLTIAQKHKMIVGGLEGVPDQVAVYEQIPYEKQALELLQSIKELQSNDKSAYSLQNEMEQVMAFYRNKDIEGMANAIGSKKYYNIENAAEIFLNQRNQKWIAKIKEFAAKQPTFFAVGAGHLGGANGVIKLLTKEGYSVTPIW